MLSSHAGIRQAVAVLAATMLVLVGIGVGLARASQSEASGTVGACVSPKGALKIADNCGRNETPLTLATGEGVQALQAHVAELEARVRLLEPPVPIPASLHVDDVMSPSVANVDLRLGVTVFDQNDSPFPGEEITVALKSFEGSGEGALVGTSSAISNHAGRAFFDDVMIDQPGFYQLQFTGQDPDLRGESNLFEVVADVASVTDVKDPSFVGESLRTPDGLPLVVSIYDGEFIGDEMVTVSLIAVDGDGTLTGALTRPIDGAGVNATFSDLRIDQSGMYQLQFTFASREHVATTNVFEVQ